MSKLKTPREKKMASLLHDRRNAFGENDKSSRKNIPLSKQRSRQSVRRRAKQPLSSVLNANEAEQVDVETKLLSDLKLGERKSFRKRPDTSLRNLLYYQRTRDWTPRPTDPRSFLAALVRSLF